MISLKTFTAAFVLLILVAGETAVADEPRALNHNPFSRPSSEKSPISRAMITTDEGSPSSLALLATLVGPEERYADVAGRIMKPGDEVDGYRLLEVQEDNATFAKDGRRFTVNVRPDETKETDE